MKNDTPRADMPPVQHTMAIAVGAAMTLRVLSGVAAMRISTTAAAPAVPPTGAAPTSSPLMTSASTSASASNPTSPPARAEAVVAPLSIAPMMDWTDRHYRFMARMLTRRAQLYTEMISDNAVIHGQPALLDFSPAVEEPLVLQLGGSVPATLGAAAKKSVERGYREINLNVGCPSDRGQGNCNYGAVLMEDGGGLVGACMAEIIDEVPPYIPCTVKCRIGVGPTDEYDEVKTFVEGVHAGTGYRVDHYIIHARRAILGMKLTPEQNRRIPNLHYDFVYRLVEDFPHLKFTLNGGVLSLAEAAAHLDKGVHGVMVGRAAYKTPWPMLRHVDSTLYADVDPGLSRREILVRYAAYAETVVAADPKALGRVLKPLVWLFAGEKKNRNWRQALETERRAGTDVVSIITKSMTELDDEVLDAL